MNKINIYKSLAWKIRYEAWDMPYPPVIFWENKYYLQDIINAWENTIWIIKKQKNNHNMWLYVHIPFCYSRCFFCTCMTSVEHKEDEYDKYLDLIEKESQILSKTFDWVEFNTVYVWWWTPTILNSKQIDRFYNILKNNFNLKNVKQIMTEWSPYTTTEEKIQILSKHWVNKMTFWVQSLDSKVLKTNNRFQQFNDVKKAVELARKYNIEYINLDVMAGIPGQEMDWFKETIDLIESLEPTTVHINSFWPTKPTTYSISWWDYSMENIKLRNEMEKYWKYLEDMESKITDTKKQNLQLYNAHNQNSSILWLWFWAISHAFSSMHYTKNNMKNYEKMLNWEKITVTWYRLNLEDEIITYLINNLRWWVYLDNFKKLFWIELNDTSIFKDRLQELINNNIVKLKKNERWEYYIFRLNSDLFCSIYSKHLFDKTLILKFEKLMDKNKGEYNDTNLRIKQFFTD